MSRNPSPIPIIGLSGGIGAGKSAVARILGGLGCFVCDSDALGRAALRDEAIRGELVRWWGEGVLDAEGEIDRSAVAAIVFSDAGQRRRLEALTHPWIEARRRASFAEAAPHAVALVIDAPLLFEARLDAECDAVIFVETDRETRLQRLRTTRGWSAEELARREDSQMPLDVKRSRADHVVENDGDLAQLTERVRRILDDILRFSEEPAKENPLRSPTESDGR